jgi:ribosomal protein S18 acetylase RimI-like enzyme
MHIRKYTSTDRENVINLLRLNTPDYFSPAEEKDLFYYLDNHLENYFVIEVKNQLLGCGGFNSSDKPEMVRLSWDIIHPQSQGKGLGRALTKFRIERIRGIEGVKIISVRTSQFVYKFYEKLGFELKETIKYYWAQGFDMYRMELIID